MVACPYILITINTLLLGLHDYDMPHGQDVEGENDPESTSEYECLQCGRIVEAKSHPRQCECGGEFQNRAKSLE
jgi:rubrerythrin